MKHQATEDFWQSYENLPDRVRRLADHNFQILKSDPYHPSLRLKQVGPLWSTRVGIGWRALAARDGDTFIWFWIGSHADYDNLLKRR